LSSRIFALVPDLWRLSFFIEDDFCAAEKEMIRLSMALPSMLAVNFADGTRALLERGSPIVVEELWKRLRREHRNAVDLLNKRRATQEHTSPPPEVPLTKEQASVLRYLAEQYPSLCTLDDIEVACRLSRNTAGNVVRSLIAQAYACRPAGERKGATATEAGRDAVR
jgi:hypothetical protein